MRFLWTHHKVTPTLLSPYARGLPSLLQALPHWHSQELATVHALLDHWTTPDHTHGLELLDHQFLDLRVRDKAAQWIDGLQEDDIIDLLPQLVQVHT